MRQFLINLLKGLEKAVPPPAECHHALTYAQYGSDSEGWVDQLALQVNQGGKFHCFFLDEDDAIEDPQRIIDFVVAALQQPVDGQLGVALGQFRHAENVAENGQHT